MAEFGLYIKNLIRKEKESQVKKVEKMSKQESEKPKLSKVTIPVINENTTTEDKKAAKGFLKDKRKYARAQFTRTYNRLETNLKTQNWGKIEFDEASILLATLSERYQELEAIQEQIVMCDLDDENEMSELDLYDRQHREVRLEIKTRFDHLTSQTKQQMPSKQKQSFSGGARKSWQEEKTDQLLASNWDNDDEEDDFAEEYNRRLKNPSQRKIGEDDVEEDKEEKHYYAMMSMNYNPSREVAKFDGTDMRLYSNFKTSWRAADVKMSKMGKPNSERLILLKKCLAGNALRRIASLADGNDENYKGAIMMLDRAYDNKAIGAKLIVKRMLELPKMGNDVASMEETFLELSSLLTDLVGLELTARQCRTLLLCTIFEMKLNNYVLKSWAKKQESREMVDHDHPLGHRSTERNLLENLDNEINLTKSMGTGKMAEQKKEGGASPPKQEKKKNPSGGDAFYHARDGGSAGESGRGGRGGHSTRGGRGGGRGGGSSSQGRACPFCKNQGHSIKECKILSGRSIDDRWKYVKEQKLCSMCFRNDHMAQDCTFKKCDINGCGKPHSRYLHANPKGAGSMQKKDENDEDITKAMAAKKLGSSEWTAILQSCLCWAISPSGERFKARAFLDGGAELSLITRKMSEIMGLDGKTVSLQLCVAGGSQLPVTQEKLVNFQLESLDGKYRSPKMEATTTKAITTDLREIPFEVSKFEHLKSLTFADDFPRKSSVVDIMVGLPYYTMLLTGKPIAGKLNEPSALPTKLGYVLTGAFTSVGITQQF